MPPLNGTLRAVAEDGIHLDPLGHVHHGAGFGDRTLSGIQFDFDELQVLTKDFEVDFVRRAARGLWNDYRAGAFRDTQKRTPRHS